MDYLEDIILAGASGSKYRFKAYRRKGPIDAIATVYVLGYLHPRGHLAGNHLVPLYLGRTDNLKARLADHPNTECLRAELCNVVCVLEGESNQKPSALFKDLAAHGPFSCGMDG